MQLAAKDKEIFQKDQVIAKLDMENEARKAALQESEAKTIVTMKESFDLKDTLHSPAVE